jgi:hypothetical protein
MLNDEGTKGKDEKSGTQEPKNMGRENLELRNSGT